jgi:shikimate dehydrogenase
MQINKDTKLYCSFTSCPGNFGAGFFNAAFAKYEINSVYLPRKAANVLDIISAARNMDIAGFALSSPFKQAILQYLDGTSYKVNETSSCNTVNVENGKLIGYNYDYYGAKMILSNCDYRLAAIIGNGGLSHTVQTILKEQNVQYKIINRALLIPDKADVVINCSPGKYTVNHFPKHKFINFNSGNLEGDLLALFQATKQLNLYTGLKISTKESVLILEKLQPEMFNRVIEYVI